MKYQVMDCRYTKDSKVDILFATNDKREAIIVADEIGSGATVVRNDEELDPEVIYIAPYKTTLELKR